MDAREATFFTAILIGVIIVGVILGYFLFSIIRLHRRYILLHKSKNEAQILLLEKERTRIAADLHDELGPILSAAKFKLIEAEPVSAYDQQLLDEAAGYIDKMIADIRVIANGLMPNTLLRKGPVHAIEEFIDDIRSTTAIKIELQANTTPALTQTQAINIYRIAQEAIHNAIKHSGAEWIKIRFHAGSDKLDLLCVDNGVGFDSYKIQNEKQGLGLQNMLTRAEMIGGKMFIESVRLQGTTLRFDIPFTLKKESDAERISD
jgi:two-component system NarL family sensor kinase